MDSAVPPRFVIIDRSLRDERGHHYALTNVITQAALQAGLSVIWFAHKEFPENLQITGVSARRVFSASSYDLFKKVARPKPPAPTVWGLLLRICRRLQRSFAYRLSAFLGTLPEFPDAAPANQETSPSLADELLAAFASEEVGPHDQVLVHTSDGDMYRAILDIALRTAKTELPQIHLVTPYDATTMPHYRRGLHVDRVIRYLDYMRFLGERVFLYGENERLAAALSQAWNVAVDTLEIPPPLESDTWEAQQGRPLNIAYLGAAREEKGFHLLPEIVDRVSGMNLGAKNVRFFVQCSPQIVGYTPLIESSIERLKTHPKGFVKLVDKQQSMDEYYAVLRDADVILACYDSEKYKVRGSGIAVEAVAFGTTVLARPHTTPAAIAKQAAELVSSVDEISAAIANIVQDRSAYVERAKARRDEYLRENSAGNYIAKIRSSQTVGEHERAELSADASIAHSSSDRTEVDTGDWRALLEHARGVADGSQACPRLLGRELFRAPHP